MDIMTSSITEKDRIKIVLADDYPLIREALRMHIEKEEDLEVIAETGDGKEAVELSLKLHPDVVIMDTDMPLLSGIEATRQITERCPGTEVLVLTDSNDSMHIHEIMRAGAGGCLKKASHGEVIIHYIRTLATGEHVFPPQTPQDLFKAVPQQYAEQLVSNSTNNLQQRELMILKLIAKGMSNKDIALKMSFSLNYIKSSITTIFAKLGVSSRTEAITKSLNVNILTLDDLKNDGFEVNNEKYRAENNVGASSL